MQRLEAELGAQLLDRSVKPPRLTPLGIRIVEQSRDVLKHVDDLKALAATDAEPSGPFRIGVSHALADGALVKPVQALTKRFPKLRLSLLSDLAGDLIAKVQAGQLDLAVVLRPNPHETCVTMSVPRSGPATLATAHALLAAPSALPRLLGG